MSADEALRLATVENIQREQLDPIDEAESFARMVTDGAEIADYKKSGSVGALVSFFERTKKPVPTATAKAITPVGHGYRDQCGFPKPCLSLRQQNRENNQSHAAISGAFLLSASNRLKIFDQTLMVSEWLLACQKK